ncbi:MAG: 16S rRNA (uracil(1498)-N(3))-methyltransferase [Bacteroidetes bacterium]|nr:16S rRNA (uracil(1498)-N(3))-methyltransferase [Bacteroidota bacterium]
MNLFYCPEINNNKIIFLSEEESAHAIRVLRMKTGNSMFLADGKGIFYSAEIISDNVKKCSVRIIHPITDSSKRSFHLTIAIAPTKSIDRFEWFLEKATEIGCDDIIPISCKHSERTVIKIERLNKVLVSAMKQCLKSQLPKLHELQDFKSFINEPLPSPSREGAGGRWQKFIGHIPELSESEFPPQNPQGKLLQNIYKKGDNALIVIGPEGGFSEEEISLAMQNEFTSISLGNSRLRVETAGIVACSIVNAIN